MLYPPPPAGDSAVVAEGSQIGVPEESNSVSEHGEETLGKVCLGFAVQPGFITVAKKVSFVNSAKDGDAST